MGKSKIEWTDSSWNPVTGCSKVSIGCRFCYAEAMTRRLKAMGVLKYRAGFDKVVCHPESLAEVSPRQKPKTIFVNSMSDLFHEDVPYNFIDQVYGTMFEARRHTYIILTKRPDRMFDYISRNAWLSNIPPKYVWLGVSVENQEMADKRIPILLQIPAAVYFVSYEPALGPVNFSPWIRSLSWIICGCESGPGRRVCLYHWIRDVVKSCRAANVPVFVKQVPERDDWHVSKVCKDINQFPPELQVREWPGVR